MFASMQRLCFVKHTYGCKRRAFLVEFKSFDAYIQLLKGVILTDLGQHEKAARIFITLSEDFLSNRMKKSQYWVKRDNRWQIIYEGATS